MSRPSTRRGALIVFEGVDRCGKTTQVSRLVSEIQKRGAKCEPMRFPDRETPTGKIIDAYLKRDASADALSDHAVHLLFSANRWEAAEKIKAKIESGVSLVLDRYAYSGACFTSAKGLDMDWCKAPDAGLPQPDAVVFLKLSIEKSRERGGFGGERYEVETFQKKVLDLFLETIDSDQKHAPGLWRVIDADQPLEAVTSGVLKALADVIGNEGDAAPPALPALGKLYDAQQQAKKRVKVDG